MRRGTKENLMLTLKGVAMGAADVVPGVSGGTIAFIVGVYEELLNSIRSINITTLKLLFTLKFRAFFEATNAKFLALLFIGILLSVMSLARIITYLLESQPILVWSLFFGLVLASIASVSRQVTRWSWSRWLAFIVGSVAAFYITIATPATTPEGLPFIFICGSIAICAMILPGISGSFILLLMGKYHYIMESIKSFDITVIGVFGAGAVIGLILFSNVLSFLLRKYHDITVALLAGFMLGSLNKVWPWKEIFIGDNGVEMTRNIISTEQLPIAILLMLIGGGGVIALERLSNNR